MANTNDIRLKYLDLVKVEKEARKQFMALEHLVSEVAGAISSHPFEFAFGNIGVSKPYPASAKRTIDGRMWPTAAQIQSALSNWYLAREEAMKVWAQLPEEERHGLTPPVGHRGQP